MWAGRVAAKFAGGDVRRSRRHPYVSTRCHGQRRPGDAQTDRASLQEDAVARVAQAKREVLLRAYWRLLYRAGLRPISEIVRDNPLAQSYVGWGAPGPGRWVSIYSTERPTPHVFVVVAGLRLDTSHAGTDVGPNSGEDGPRWRVLDRIPEWAHWSVRHPPGL